MNETPMMVFSGNANLALSEGIVKKLNMRLGMATVGRFSDGEIAVEIEKMSVVRMFLLFSLLAPLPMKI